MSEIRSQTTPARDELADVVIDTFFDATNVDEDAAAPIVDTGYAVADRLLAAGWSKPRTVNSAAELDALPIGSVILVDAGRYGANAWQKHANGRWCEASHYEESMTSTELRMRNLPTTVLFTPGDAG